MKPLTAIAMVLVLIVGFITYCAEPPHASTLGIVCPDGSTWNLSGSTLTCIPPNNPPQPPQTCPPGTHGTPPNCVPDTPPPTLTNCTNQGFAVIPASPVPSPWGSGVSRLSATDGSFGNNTIWLFTITPPAGTGNSAVTGRAAISEYGGPQTARQLTISKTPCDFRPPDFTGQNGPLSVSNGNTASIIFGVCTPSFFGGVACMVPGTTYYVSARNWQLDPTPQWSCGQPTCNAIMNVQPASP